MIDMEDEDWSDSAGAFIARLHEIEAELDRSEPMGEFITEWAFASEDNPTWDEWRAAMTPGERRTISDIMARIAARYDQEEAYGLACAAEAIRTYETPSSK